MSSHARQRCHTSSHRPKIAVLAFFVWGAMSPSSTMWPEPRPTSVPSGILIRPANLAARRGPKSGGRCCAPFFGGRGELGLRLTQCGWAEAYLHAKFHLDPSNCLATIHQRYTDRQRDRICNVFGSDHGSSDQEFLSVLPFWVGSKVKI